MCRLYPLLCSGRTLLAKCTPWIRGPTSSGSLLGLLAEVFSIVGELCSTSPNLVWSSWMDHCPRASPMNSHLSLPKLLKTLRFWEPFSASKLLFCWVVHCLNWAQQELNLNSGPMFSSVCSVPELDQSWYLHECHLFTYVFWSLSRRTLLCNALLLLNINPFPHCQWKRLM